MNELKFKKDGTDYVLTADGNFTGKAADGTASKGTWTAVSADKKNALTLKTTGKKDVTVPVDYDFVIQDDPACFNMLSVAVASEGTPAQVTALFGGTIKIGKNSEIRYELGQKSAFILYSDVIKFSDHYKELIIEVGKREVIIEGRAVLDQSKSANENERDLLQFSTSTSWVENGKTVEKLAEIEFRGSLALDDSGDLKFIGSFEGTRTYNLALAGNYKLGSAGLEIYSKDGKPGVRLATRGSFNYRGSSGSWDIGLGYSKSTGLSMKAGVEFESNTTGPDGSAKMKGKATVTYEKRELKAELEFGGKFELKDNRSLEFVVTGKLVEGSPSFGFAGTAVVSKDRKITFGISHDSKETKIQLGYEGPNLTAKIEILRGKSGIKGAFMVNFTLDLDGRQRASKAQALPGATATKAATGTRSVLPRGVQSRNLDGGDGGDAVTPRTPRPPINVPDIAPLDLESFIGKGIDRICRNGFHNSGENHCAHFVCHVLGVDSGYDCKTHKQGRHKGSCIRVHELFEVCPQVGPFEELTELPCIVFVTEIENVDLAAHTMENDPQKHVGIYDGQAIYHYSNTMDKVVKQSPEDFLARFESIYDGKQALYFGTMPLEIRRIDVTGAPKAILVIEEEVTPVAVAAPVAVSAITTAVPAAGEATPAAVNTNGNSLAKPPLTLREHKKGKDKRGNEVSDYYAREQSGAEYYVGASTVTYPPLKGIFQPGGKLTGPIFNALDYAPRLGPLAALLGVIAASESAGRFNRINSYDRAGFTFGFFQLAAHTPNDNLILLFRRLAKESAKFNIHFPELSVRDGQLHRRVGEDRWISLEKEYTRPGKSDELNLKDFMAYLKPKPDGVDSTELDVAARLVLLSNDPDFNGIQVTVAAEITMKKIANRYDKWYDLHGVSDVICTAIADIHHQGRATKSQVKAALAESGVTRQLNALCALGANKYPERCRMLKAKLKEAMDQGLLGQSVFDSASDLFKPKNGWPA